MQKNGKTSFFKHLVYVHHHSIAEKRWAPIARFQRDESAAPWIHGFGFYPISEFEKDFGVHHKSGLIDKSQLSDHLFLISHLLQKPWLIKVQQMIRNIIRSQR